MPRTRGADRDQLTQSNWSQRKKGHLLMSAVRIQLALQGGGAKFFSLIAALSAIQKLEQEHAIEVTRIAGTSAGAIAGALYAAKVPMEKVVNWLSAPDRAELLQRLKGRHNYLKYLKIFLGRPLIDPALLEQVLKDLFKLNDIDVGSERLKSFEATEKRIPFISLYTDLQNNTVGQHGRDTTLLSALMESAGLPFVFRTFKSTGRDRVDGGICENLPATIFQAKSDEPVVALAFIPSVNYTNSLKSYGLSLMSTAIDHSVSRAKAHLGDEYVCELKTKIATLDFHKILGQENEVEFNSTRDATEKFFRTLVRKERRRQLFDGDKWMECSKGSSRWSNDLRQYMENLGDIYQAQHGRNRPTVQKLRSVITLHSKDGELDINRVTFKHTRTFSGGNSPIFATKIQLSTPPDAELENYSVKMYGNRSSPIQFMRTPVFDRSSPAVEGNDVSRPLIMWPLDTSENLLGNFILEMTAEGIGLFPEISKGELQEIVLETKNFDGVVGSAQIIVVADERILCRFRYFTLEQAFANGYKIRNPDYLRPDRIFNVAGQWREVSPQQAGQEAAKLGLDAVEPGNGMRIWEAAGIPTPETVGVVFGGR